MPTPIAGVRVVGVHVVEMVVPAIAIRSGAGVEFIDRHGQLRGGPEQIYQCGRLGQDVRRHVAGLQGLNRQF